jgi:uncharacterized protein (TIGR02145 family)
MKKIYFSICLMLITAYSLSQWTTLSSVTKYNLYSVYFVDGYIGYAIGEAGIILKTINGGIDWTFLSSEKNNDLRSVYFINPNEGFAIGKNGTILKTINGGTQWMDYSINTTSLLLSLFFTDSNTGYVVGENGTILKTKSRGVFWRTLPSGTSEVLFSINFTNDSTGYAVGDNGTILKTIDGGTIWNKLPSGTTNNLNSVFFINNDTGYAVGDNGTILITIDGGITWNKLSSGTANFLNSVYFIDTDTGYSVGDDGTILKTTDGGTTWTSLSGGTTNRLWSVCLTVANTGYAVGDSGIIIKTNYVSEQSLTTQEGSNLIPSLNFTSSAQKIEDPITGNYANTVKINNLLWTTMNLNVSHYRNGDPIPCAKTKYEWIKYANEGIGCYRDYENDPTVSRITGKLYNWYAVMDKRELAPKGFIIPRDEDWKNLIRFLNVSLGNSRIVKANFGWGQTSVKQYGVSYQSGYSINVQEKKYGNGTNSSGFSAVPAGFVTKNGEFYGIGEVTHWWSITEVDENSAKEVFLSNMYDFLTRSSSTKKLGFSVSTLSLTLMFFLA